ncbi:LIV-I protein H [Thalassovita gelatinovora]|uniref:LIV-I protein H n=1 Tax=Thalassovita gelatinovora TaxID=53501 RepID=A0A0P1FTR3_THAGE|nr:branched-chain amino acid ABC transporter permease [Thalassovita gelatinovora]QIZ80903.1 branched-chain amino acid ABC transporter permease [Thalassovita gelatinovora]CUH63385.1 LIV-I protein H [Thalassovita gelatinovora]SEQ66161.1 amino acid/amide ABC transporter membrane protein 1, HAAT family [Thalassovita gelatinovora]
MISQLIGAVLLGGYYAVLATGLAFMFSVMNIINLAHGALIVLSAYGLYVLGGMMGLPIAIPIMIIVMFVVGLALHALILARASKGGELLPLLATFGLSIILDNLMFQVFGADSLSLAPLVGDLSWASFELPGFIFVGKLSVYTLIAAVAVIAGLEWLLRRTTLGHRIQATSQDRATARLLGIDTARTAAIATGLALATGVIAATALGLRTAWGPYAGSAQLLFAFEAVVIGGMGSLWRVLWGAMILALAQSLAAMIHPQGFLIGGHLAFLLAVFWRLRGGAFSLNRLLGREVRT